MGLNTGACNRPWMLQTCGTRLRSDLRSLRQMTNRAAGLPALDDEAIDHSATAGSSPNLQPQNWS